MAPRQRRGFIDLREAAGGVATGGIGIAATWFTGTVAAGGSQGWTWTNAPADTTYVVGFNPSGASTSDMCQFEVTSTRYIQQFGGERQFQLIIKNAGAIACGARFQLTALASPVIASTGGVNPGGTVVGLLNVGWDTNWVVGLNPSGATSTAPCQFQITRNWYVQPSSGLRQFWFEIKNVGTIACQADIRVSSGATGSSFVVSTTNPGSSRSVTWNNANPVTSAYLIGVAPASASPNQCQFEVTRVIYRQHINTDGSSERELRITFKNVGTVACSGLAQLLTIAA